MEDDNLKMYQFFAQILLAAVLFGTQKKFGSDNVHEWTLINARYVVYILLIRGSGEVFALAHKLCFRSDPVLELKKAAKDNKRSLVLFMCMCALLLFNSQPFGAQEFLLLFVAYLITQYPKMDEGPVMISYGVGMACSFFEGYLTHVIPSDGAKFVGFQENIRTFESSQGVVFPVKRLFIVIPKSLFCPPDLKHFNKLNRPDLPYLEACKSLEDVMKDVAGVKNRMYRNSAYKIHRGPGLPLVYLSAEFATPLHTLHRVLEKRALYERLCDVDVSRVVSEFCEQLETTIARSHDCRDKCTLVHYDDTNDEENLASVLLDKIREIEPNFEDVISRQKEDA